MKTIFALLLFALFASVESSATDALTNAIPEALGCANDGCKFAIQIVINVVHVAPPQVGPEVLGGVVLAGVLGYAGNEIWRRYVEPEAVENQKPKNQKPKNQMYYAKKANYLEKRKCWTVDVDHTVYK